MPTLKQLTCQIQWANTNAPFHEYGTVYGDGVVETFIVVPNNPQAFSIHLKSKGFIYQGLSMIVFIDGTYQCNRNRVNLVPVKKDTPRCRSEVDFVVRQKEKPMGEGIYMGREWRFDCHNIVTGVPEGIKSSHFDLLGTIEVLVLRCHPSPSGDLASSTTSSGADSDVLHQSTVDQNKYQDDETKHNTKADQIVGGKQAPTEAVELESTIFPFAGLFDGQDDGFLPFEGREGRHPPGYSPSPRRRHESSMNFPETYYRSYGHEPPGRPSFQDSRFERYSSAHRRPQRHVHFDLGGRPGQDHQVPYDSRTGNEYPPFWQHRDYYPSERAPPDFHLSSQTPNLRQHYQEYHPAHYNYDTDGYDYDRYADAPRGPVEGHPPPQPPPPASYGYQHFVPPYSTIPHHPWSKPRPPWVSIQPFPISAPVHGINSHYPTPVQYPIPYFAQGPGFMANPASAPGHSPGMVDQGISGFGSQAPEGLNPNQCGLDPAKEENNTTGKDDNWLPSNSNPGDVLNSNEQFQSAAAATEPDWSQNQNENNDIQTWGSNANHSKKDNDWENNDTGNDQGWADTDAMDTKNNTQSGTSNIQPLYGPYGPLYTFQGADTEDVPADAEEEPRYDVPQSIAADRGTTKQVQPGRGYLYTKKRCIPNYVDSLDEPYARFVFKYRTRGTVVIDIGFETDETNSITDQVKNEIGVDVEDEPTGNEEIQALQNMDKSQLIEMLLRAKGALGGEIPGKTTALSNTKPPETTSVPVPVDPPALDFLKYTLPPKRRNTSAGQNPSTGTNDDGWGNNDSSAKSKNNADCQWLGDKTTSGGHNWDGVQEKDNLGETTQQQFQDVKSPKASSPTTGAPPPIGDTWNSPGQPRIEGKPAYRSPSILEIPDSPPSEPQDTWR